MKHNSMIIIFFLSTFFIGTANAALVFVSYTYEGDGGVIPDNCYPLECTFPSLDKFESSIFVTEDFIVSDVIFSFTWNHSASTDIIDFNLSGPSGWTDITHSRPCMDTDGGTYTFSDNAINDISSFYLSYGSGCIFGRAESGAYKPYNSFRPFVGESSYGEWNLSIFDGFSLDEGYIESWQLTLVREVSAPKGLALMCLSLIVLCYSSKKRSK